MKLWIIALCGFALLVGGCITSFHRTDTDWYVGAKSSYTGNGRSTAMTTSQPATITHDGVTSQPTEAPVIPPRTLKQVEPSVGQVFILKVHGKAYEAMKKTDGRVYIIREIR